MQHCFLVLVPVPVQPVVQYIRFNSYDNTPPLPVLVERTIAHSEPPSQMLHDTFSTTSTSSRSVCEMDSAILKFSK